jgi:hypothetical protein
MPIAFACPGCRKTIKAKESLAGRKLPCPGCGHALTVPTIASDAAPSPAPASSAPTPNSSVSPRPAVKAAPPAQGNAPAARTIAENSTAKPRAAATFAAAVKPARPADPPGLDLPPLPGEILATVAPQSAPPAKVFNDVQSWDDLEEEEFKLQPFDKPAAAPPLLNPYTTITAGMTSAGLSSAAAKPKTLQPAAPATGPLKPSLAFRAAASNPVWQRRMLLVFILALIPLAFNILLPDPIEFEQHFEETIAEMDIEQISQLHDLKERSDDGEDIEDKQLFALMPDQRLRGAFLAYDSKAHWFMAAGASLLFMGLLVAMSMDGSTRAWQLIAISAFTATGGIVLLLGFQYLAVWSAGAGFGGRGIFALLFFFVKLIGYSYHAAMDPTNGFIPSMLGFTFGVGLCEEFCKAMPLLAYFKNEANVTWRGAMLWGLASGIGFGIAEGIMYSGDYYNGRAFAGMYFVRFFSCVALHAIWTATVAITLYRRQDEWQHADEWYEHGIVVLKVIFIPMVLHGLYDTLLKQEYATYALLTAAASFGYLGWLNYYCERHE